VATEILDWLKAEDNREAVLALLAVATALLGGGWFLYDRLFPGAEGGGGASQQVRAGGDVGQVQLVGQGAVGVIAGAGSVVTVGYTVEQHEARLARREAELRAELGDAHAGEKAALVAQLDEVRRQKADVEASWAARKAELKRAAELLDTLAAGLPELRLEAAQRALDEGDSAKADALFAEVEAMEAAAVGRAAAAAFERGRLAEGEVRCADAAAHYATAVRLAPCFDHLFAARVMAWRAGDYPAARRWGEDLLKSAVLEHGENSPEHVRDDRSAEGLAQRLLPDRPSPIGPRLPSRGQSRKRDRQGSRVPIRADGDIGASLALRHSPPGDRTGRGGASPHRSGGWRRGPRGARPSGAGRDGRGTRAAGKEEGRPAGRPWSRW
jgi:hypothetical protein